MRVIQLGVLVVAVMAVAACGSSTSGTAGSGGSAGGGGSAGSGGNGFEPPVDQCVNDADQGIFDDLGGGAIGDIAADCPLSSCGGQIGAILGGDTSEGAVSALSDCVAECVSDETGLSTECASCYGLITACAVGTCLEPCLPPNSDSPECAQCSLENCSFFDACLGI